MPAKPGSVLKKIGPGIAIAATGIGAGDLIAAAVAGARFGTAILWAALIGALLKYTLNEGIARWQLATGTTLVAGWAEHLSRPLTHIFFAYLMLWSFIVAGALISACGLAAHALFPAISVPVWGIIHSLAAALLVLRGNYSLFENTMKFFIGLMFAVMLLCAALIVPELIPRLPNLLTPVIPPNSGSFLLGVIGGVGGSVTLLSYGYWIRERGWDSASSWHLVRLDLGSAYLLTGLFAASVIIISSGINPQIVSGTGMALAVAERLAELTGAAGKWSFLLGFWGAVFSSMIGVWQGVPYLLADTFARFHSRRPASEAISSTSPVYRYFLIYLTLPPMLLLLFQKPVIIVIIYSITGAFFIPFLAATLLYMNGTTRWVGRMKNSAGITLLLLAALLLFAYLFFIEIMRYAS